VYYYCHSSRGMVVDSETESMVGITQIVTPMRQFDKRKIVASKLLCVGNRGVTWVNNNMQYLTKEEK
jgi:hypothetical protein